MRRRNMTPNERLHQGEVEGRADFVRDNAVALLAEKQAKIDDQAKALHRLNAMVASLRAELEQRNLPPSRVWHYPEINDARREELLETAKRCLAMPAHSVFVPMARDAASELQEWTFADKKRSVQIEGDCSPLGWWAHLRGQGGKEVSANEIDLGDAIRDALKLAKETGL